MKKLSYKIINGITIYRIVAAPILVYLAVTKNLDLFKWLLPVSFFTDLIDGYLARRFKVTSIAGSKLDSIGDDLTIVAAIIGAFFFNPQFINEELIIIAGLFGLLLLQNVLALLRYKKTTSFHTYLAKTAALFQGFFFILLFFFKEPFYLLFYIAAIFTFLELVEEIILVLILSKWETNVKGIYWILKRKNTGQHL